MEVRKISEEHIQKYRSDILRSSSASTFDRKIFSLKKFFEWAVKEGYIDESPVEQFLKNEQNVIEQSLGKIEKQRKLTTPSYSSIQSRIIAKFAGKPKLQKLVYNLFYKRPQWYLTYHNLPIASYFNYAILFLLMSAVGYGAYNQFFKRTSEPLAYPTALTAPSRFLSFQGRLTDKNGNPITAVTDLEFKLYNASESGTLLWDSGVCSISPDPDGIFSTLLGSSCGSEIASSVFSENSAVWLGATVGADTEATPRVQIATVAYALNSETLQGFPASMSATAYTIPAINSSGYLVLGSSSPKLQSTSGTFAIEGQALTITTPNTSNGSIAINPDGTGTLNLTFEGAAPGGSAQGFVNATNANLTSQALYYGEVANDATGYNLLELASGTTPRTKFAIDSGGNATLSGTINGLAISGGTVTTGVWNGTAIGTQYGGTGADWHTVVQGSIPYFSGTGAMSTLAPDTSGYVLMTQGTSANPKWANAATLGTNYWQLANHVLSPANHADYDLAVGGTSTASAKFQVFAANGNLTTAGTASVSGNLTLGNGSALQSAYGPLTLNYKSGANAYTAGLSLTNSGYVGIGKTDPGYLLDVNGNARTTGTLYVDALVDKDYSGNSITFPSVLNVKIGGGYGLNVSSETVGTRLNLSGGDTGPTSAVTKIDMTGNTVSTSHPNYAYQWIGINHALTLNLQGTLGSNNQDVSIFKSVITTTNDLVGGKRLFLEFSKDSANKFLVDFSGNLYAAGYATASASLALGNTTARTGPGNLNASGRITGVEIYQGANQVCDSSGAGCPASMGLNYWQLSNHVLAPANYTDYDLAVGGTATSSAKFQVLASNGNLTTAGTASVSGNLTLGNGSAIQSAYGPVTLNYKSGADAYTAGLSLTNSGYVGIGTTNPSQKLQVKGNVLIGDSAAGNANITGDDNPTINLNWITDERVGITSNANAKWTGGGTLLGAIRFGSGSSYALIGNTGATTNLLLNPYAGNVGIGTISPTALLDVAGAASASGSLSFRIGAATVGATGMSDLTLGSSTTGNVVINSRGSTALTANGADLTAGGNANLTASTNLIFGGTTSLGETTSPTDSGAYMVGANDEFTYATSTNVQGVLKEFDTKLGTLSSSNYWSVLSNNTIYPTTTVEDLLLGSSATSSAKFAFTGVGSGVPNILINNASVLNATTLGTSVVTSSLTTVGALASGSIANGFGTIATSNTITGTTINGTTGINTGATAGTQRIDASGNLVNIANISASGYATVSASLALGNTNAAVGPGHLDMSGNLNVMGNTTLGDATTDTITFTGRVAQDADLIPIGTTGTNDLGASTLPWDNIYLASAGSLFLDSDTALSDTGLNDAGAYSVGTYDEFTYSSSTNVQDVLHDLDTQLGTVGTNYWRLAGNVLAPTQIAYDLVVGGSATGSAFQVFAQTGNVTLADLSITGGNINPSAALTIGDNGDTLTLDSSDWDIGATGDMTGIGAITADGTISFTGTTIGLGTSNSATAINIGSGTGGNTINIAGTGATGADTVNIGTGATGADAVNIGSANAGAVTIRSNAALGLTGSTGSFLTFPNFAVDTNGIITKIDNVAHTIDDVSGNLTLTSNSNTISLNDNTSVVGYATASASLALGNTNAAVGPGHLNMSGNLTLAGLIDANGTGTHDIAGTLNLSGNALSSTGDLSIDAGGGDINLGSGDNLNLTASTDLFFGTTSLGETTSNTDSGAYIVGVNDEFTYATATNVQGVLKEFDTKLGTLSSSDYWSVLSNNTIYPTNTLEDLLLGSSATASAKFAFTGVGSGTPNILINNVSVLNPTTLGSGVTTSSLTTVGALASGSIATGFGTITTANTITGTTINGTTGINTGATAGTQRIDANGNLVNILNISATGNATISGVLTLGQAFKPGGSAGTAGQVLTSAGGYNAPTWTDLPAAGTNYWQYNSNVLAPGNTTFDVAIGGNATSSSKFQVMGTTGNIYTANNTVDWTLNNAADALNFDANTLSIDALNNRVGIGTTNPGAKLEAMVAQDNYIFDLTNGTETEFKLRTYNDGTTVTNANAFTQGLYYTNQENAAIHYYRGGTSLGGWLTFTTNNGSERMRIDASGNVGIGTTNPTQKLDVNGNFNLTGYATMSASLALGNTTAVAGPGNLRMSGDATISGVLSLGQAFKPGNDAGTSGYLLTSAGGGVNTWTNPATLGTNYWSVLSNNTIYPTNTLEDLLLGSSATASAKFAFTGVGSGTPNILINNVSVLNPTTLGTGVVTSSLTTVGALASGSIANGFGTIATSNTITGTTLNGTTGINTGATAGTQRIDANGNLVNILNISATGNATISGVLTLGQAFKPGGSAGTAGQVLTSAGGYNAPTWTDSTSFGTNHWQLASGVLAPINTTNDIATGGTATGSAKFMVMGKTGNIYTANNTVDWTLNNAADALNFDSDTLSIDASNNRVGIGVNNPAVKLEVLNGATNQLRLSYNSSNYTNLYTTSTGILTIAPSGEGASLAKTYTTDAAYETLNVNSSFSTNANTQYNAGIETNASIGTNVTAFSLFKAGQVSISNSSMTYLSAFRTHSGASDNPWTYCSSGTCSVTNLYGGLFNQSTGVASGATFNVENEIGMTFSEINDYSFGGTMNITNRKGIYFGGINNANTAVTNNYVIDIAAQTGQSTTNNYGLRIGNITNGTNNYAIYTGTGKVSFGDNVSITGYATMSASLALGNTTAAKGPGHLNMSGDLRVGGNVYLGNNQIMNSGDVNLIALTSNPQLTPSYLYASWAVSNGAAGNPGLASLLVDQTKSGDLFTASASGTPKFTINTSGNIAATGTITGLTGITSSGTINFSGLTASRALFTDASSNLSSTGTSAMIANAISDETGSAGLVFQNQPGFTGYISTPIVYGSIVTTNGLTLAGNNWTGNTATAANITFKVGDSAGTTAMTILNNANVGIGTTGPTTLLGVAGTASISGTLTLGNGSSNAIQSAYGPLTLNYKSGADAWTAGLSLTNSGYVGIGTATPNTTLDVLGTITAQSTSGRGMIDLFKNTTANQTGGFGIGRITFSNLVNLAYQTESSPLGNITVVHDASGATNSYPTRMEFAVTPSGEATASTQMTLDSTGYLGIGVSAPAEELDIAGQIQFDLDGTTDTTIGVCKDVADGTGVESNVEFRDCSTTPGDIAEYYAAEADLRPGDVVAIATVNGKPTLVRTSGANQQNIFGVVSTYPVGQFGKPLSGDTISADEFPTAIALTGKLPVKVSLEGGPIVAGDALTSSSIPGVAMKANKSGKIIGYAVEPYNGSIIVSSEVRKQEIMRSEAIVKFNQDPVDPTEEGVGKILMAAGTSWFDSGIYLADNGNLNIVSGNNGEYKLTDSTDNNSVVENVGAFAKASIANIKAGLINTIDIVASGSIQAANFIAENINTGAATIGDLTTNTFTAFQGTVDNLLVKSGLVAGSIETALISPLPGEDLAVELPQDSKLKIQDSNQNEVASIDSSGNVKFEGEVTSNQLSVNSEATIGGTLYADSIKSKSLDDIEALLAEVQTDQNLLKEAADWSTLTSTNSANLDQLALADLYVTNQAAINSLSVTNNLAIGTDFILGSDSSLNTLSSPLQIQSLALAPVEIMAGLIKIDTSGNVQIAGNLAVAGRVSSSGLTLQGSTLQVNEATPSSLLSLQGSNGTDVATIDASGSATFNNVLTQGLTIAGATAEATTSAIVDGVITSNATAGSAIIPAGSSEITIKNNNVTDYTLVYVTPTSTTNNYVLYVKSKGQGQFVVGFTNAIDVDVNFNWWIVKVSQ